MKTSEPLESFLEKTFGALDGVLDGYKAEMNGQEVGTLKSLGNGIARVEGLPGVRSEELILFPDNVLGMVFNVDATEVGVILLGESPALKAGAEVKRTRRILEVPVGEGLIGRLVDPMGRPLDGLGPVGCAERRPVEREAPEIMDRAPVTVPLQTGLKVVDALIPIGRGQRELILGDRQTGKTAIALDTIINPVSYTHLTLPTN